MRILAKSIAVLCLFSTPALANQPDPAAEVVALYAMADSKASTCYVKSQASYSKCLKPIIKLETAKAKKDANKKCYDDLRTDNLHCKSLIKTTY